MHIRILAKHPEGIVLAGYLNIILARGTEISLIIPPRDIYVTQTILKWPEMGVDALNYTDRNRGCRCRKYATLR